MFYSLRAGSHIKDSRSLISQARIHADRRSQLWTTISHLYTLMVSVEIVNSHAARGISMGSRRT